jgi:hypothetical protein
LVFRKLVGNFFVRSLVGVPKKVIIVDRPVDWNAPVGVQIIAIPRRQGLADRLFVLLFLVVVVPAKAVWMRPSTIVAVVKSAPASAR